MAQYVRAAGGAAGLGERQSRRRTSRCGSVCRRDAKAVSEESWTPSRRMYPAYDAASSSGSTADCMTLASKRRCSAPPAMARPISGRRQFFDVERQESHLIGRDATVQPPPAGRRHVAPPEDHVGGCASQVVWECPTPSGRRHLMEVRTESARALARRLRPAQKRHLMANDHLLGCHVYLAEDLDLPSRRMLGRRCWSDSPTFTAEGVAMALGHLARLTPRGGDDGEGSEEAGVPASSCRSASASAASRRPPRCPDGHLIGGALRAAVASAPEGPVRPSRRPAPDTTSLLGHAVVREAAPGPRRVASAEAPPRRAPLRAPSPCRVKAPQDNLFGATFRPAAHGGA